MSAMLSTKVVTVINLNLINLDILMCQLCGSENRHKIPGVTVYSHFKR